MLSDSGPFRYSPSLQLRVFLETISSSVASPLSPCVGCVNSYIIRKKQQKTGPSVRALNLSVQWYNGGNPVCCSALKCKENSGADISCLMYPANIRSQVYLQVNFCTTKTLKFDLLIHCWQESKCTVKVKRKYTKQNFFLIYWPWQGLSSSSWSCHWCSEGCFSVRWVSPLRLYPWSTSAHQTAQ